MRWSGVGTEGLGVTLSRVKLDKLGWSGQWRGVVKWSIVRWS